MVKQSDIIDIDLVQDSDGVYKSPEEVNTRSQENNPIHHESMTFSAQGDFIEQKEKIAEKKIKPNRAYANAYEQETGTILDNIPNGFADKLVGKFVHNFIDNLF
jgi:hypothetical protein